MSSGLIALLDDVAAFSKLAAATLDDAAGQAAKVAGKAAGIVIDDAAVTPRYVVGLAAKRELPIIRRIAVGSLKNKTIYILPGALALSALAPWSITPILMLGGVYLAMEGFGKVAESFRKQEGRTDAADSSAGGSAGEIEERRIRSAVRTDFILSAEIMAIALASLPDAPLWLQAITLLFVGVAMTVVVYGAVAIFVKADDVGVALAESSNALLGATGRGLVRGMPIFLSTLAVIGTLAMLWVSGGILLHGLATLGLPAPEQALHHAAERVASALPSGVQGLTVWLVQAAMSGVIGLAVGAVAEPVVHRLVTPLLGKLRLMRGAR